MTCMHLSVVSVAQSMADSLVLWSAVLLCQTLMWRVHIFLSCSCYQRWTAKERREHLRDSSYTLTIREVYQCTIASWKLLIAFLKAQQSITISTRHRRGSYQHHVAGQKTYTRKCLSWSFKSPRSLLICDCERKVNPPIPTRTGKYNDWWLVWTWISCIYVRCQYRILYKCY